MGSIVPKPLRLPVFLLLQGAIPTFPKKIRIHEVKDAIQLVCIDVISQKLRYSKAYTGPPVADQ